MGGCLYLDCISDGFFPGMTQHRSTPISKMANGAGEDVVAKTHHLTVLATQAEKLHIPKNDYVQVIRPRKAPREAQLETALVYPSALPIILDGKPDWFKEVKRFVFVRVPDDKTMGMILAASGLSSEQSDWEKIIFPCPSSSSPEKIPGWRHLPSPITNRKFPAGLTRWRPHPRFVEADREMITNQQKLPDKRPCFRYN